MFTLIYIRSLKSWRKSNVGVKECHCKIQERDGELEECDLSPFPLLHWVNGYTEGYLGHLVNG